MTTASVNKWLLDYNRIDWFTKQRIAKTMDKQHKSHHYVFFFESVMFAWHIGELPGTNHAPWISLRVANHLLSTFFFTDSQIAADSGEGCTNAWSNTHTLDNRASQRFWLQILSAYPSRSHSTAGWVHDVRCEVNFGSFICSMTYGSVKTC